MTGDRSFSGRVVVLTGASAGIGRELALRLAAERPRLVLAARDAAKLEEVAARCRELGAEALVVPTDVGDEAACGELVRRAVEAFGGVDLLLLNAGQDMWARLDELEEPAILERLMRVNYLGPAWIARHALPHLVARRGRIVVVSSLAGLTGVPTRTGYCASKHALHGFFDSLRCELATSGVSVTLVCPDFVVSEIHRRAYGPDGRPLGESPMRESKLMTAARCAELVLDAARKRKRLVLLSARGKAGRWVRLFAPGLIDRIAVRAVARGH
jgi:NAD(P)-dependent dehydrogenase (short-subunit alcohol dehydrogenase family)